MKTVKVRAIENGHDGVQYRSAGEVFEADQRRLKDGSTWFVESGDAAAAEDTAESGDAE